MNGTTQYWLIKIIYGGWIYTAIMLFFGGGVSNNGHLILLSLLLFILQNYITENT